MSTATAGPDSAAGPASTSPARLDLATALRRLGNSLVAHQPDDALLDRITALIEDLLPEVERAPDRPHAFFQTAPTFFGSPVVQGPPKEPGDVFPDCVVSGRANPMGIAARLWREGDEAVCQVTLGAAFEGAPGRAHGGIVAALIDETMGLVLSIVGSPGFTGRLTVTYRAPTPLGVPLEVRARLSDRDGRKMTISAEMRAADRLVAQAEGLFITVDTEQFLSADPK
ncbi:MAG: PaaI family thioesterase [Acidimicrobiales bacterium]